LFTYIAYIMGAFFVMLGLIKLKEHSAHPDKVPFTTPLLHIVGGSFLATLPVIAGVAARSMNLNGPSSVTKNAANGYVGFAAATPGLDTMLINFVNNVRGPLLKIILVIAFLVGIYLVLTAVLRLAKNNGRDGPAGALGSGTIGRLVIGAILISFSTAVDAFTMSLFGGTTVQFTGLDPSLGLGSIDKFNNAIKAALMFFQILGFIAFMRGFLMLRALADGAQGASMAAAFTHIFGGALAFNISPTLKALQGSFGITVGNFS
jgi:hypothetical protein